MNKRYKLRRVGHTLQIVDSKQLGRVVKTFEDWENDDAELMLNSLNESYELRADVAMLEQELNQDARYN